MSADRYQLYFGPLKLGTVTEVDRDFPNLSGTIVLEPWLAHPSSAAARRLARFVALNKESIRLLDREDEQDTSQEQARVDAELDALSADYIETDAWRLVDAQGRELPILCPVFHGDDEIVWRWNPT